MKDKIIELLTQLTIFQSFSPSAVNEKFFKKGFAKIVHYTPDETIIFEGKYDNWVFWLIDGKIEVLKNNISVATFQRIGDMFGEMGILEGDARSATVTACIPTVCLKIDMSILDHPELKSKINQEQFCREVAQVTKNRLAKTTYRMAEVEIELSATKQKLQNAEEKRQETMKTLKKTLNLLDQKDSELSSLKQEMEFLKAKLQNPRE